MVLASLDRARKAKALWLRRAQIVAHLSGSGLL
jgi:hypothetical protein